MTKMPFLILMVAIPMSILGQKSFCKIDFCGALTVGDNLNAKKYYEFRSDCLEFNFFVSAEASLSDSAIKYSKEYPYFFDCKNTIDSMLWLYYYIDKNKNNPELVRASKLKTIKDKRKKREIHILHIEFKILDQHYSGWLDIGTDDVIVQLTISRQKGDNSSTFSSYGSVKRE